MAMHTDLPIHKAAFDLLSMATDITRNIPRDLKAGLGAKVRDECIEVVMPERLDIPHRDEFESSDQYAAAVGESKKWNACLDEVARLNAAPVQKVSVPDGWKLVPVEPTHEMLGAALMNQVECLDAIAVIRADYKAMLAAAPAAPAADAGVTDYD